MENNLLSVIGKKNDIECSFEECYARDINSLSSRWDRVINKEEKHYFD